MWQTVPHRNTCALWSLIGRERQLHPSQSKQWKQSLRDASLSCLLWKGELSEFGEWSVRMTLMSWGDIHVVQRRCFKCAVNSLLCWPSWSTCRRGTRGVRVYERPVCTGSHSTVEALWACKQNTVLTRIQHDKGFSGSVGGPHRPSQVWNGGFR